MQRNSIMISNLTEEEAFAAEASLSDYITVSTGERQNSYLMKLTNRSLLRNTKNEKK